MDQLPAVNAAGFGDGLDLNGRAIHFFLCFQLDLIGRNTVGKIKTAAGVWAGASQLA